MAVILQSGYTLPGADQPLTHARIAHSGNWLSGGTAADSTTDSDYFAQGPLGSLTYEKWKPTALTAFWEYNHGSAALCNYCVIGAHSMGTSGTTLEVQYWSGSSWVDLIPSTAISDDMPIMAIFGEQTRQRWRLQIYNGTAPTVGVVKFGYSLQMERPLYGGHSPMFMSRRTTMRQNVSESGEWLGRTKQRTSQAGSFSWQHLSATWVRANWPLFQTSIETEPFFIAWRPETFGDVSMCWSDQTPVPTNMGIRDLMEVSLNVTGYGYD